MEAVVFRRVLLLASMSMYLQLPGAIVINAGDLLQILSNDVSKSTFHRVVSPPDAPATDDGNFSARYSIALCYQMK
ncbi:uncharacterized protein Z518_05126 [Rhinocladiella mackenziei CBS 650.93]|uniref:Rhinocladiella mackenziei CBS 650.93 unplaced genomic scaffold supercont1.3, whole genome shotgun sequence n=1 Tax=Rhinocladiella mackenziei CBS 650.93 TaxID=1442369 RepID=A0A0D2IMX8_9EURO|nr:uncharacterized protein Z518_05126 [Rhinocladiella mackenziei CBS 650.93]KIX07149.1 hypothetical protein Z518_05126 [Rhinocladiella mackenziei CBS 650.93]